MLEMLSKGKHDAQEGLLQRNKDSIPYHIMPTTQKCFIRLKLFLVVTKKLKEETYPLS